MNLLLRNIKVFALSRKYSGELASAERLRRQAKSSSPEAVNEIVKYLNSDSWEVRNAAIKVIAEARCKELFPVLIERLLDKREAGIVRRNCAEILCLLRYDEPQVLDALCESLTDKYWEVRSECARAIAARCGETPEVEELIIKLLGSERNFEVRASFAQALGAVGTPERAVPVLERITREDSSWLVRRQAAVAMTEIASRKTEHVASVRQSLKSLDLLAEGTTTTSVFRDHIMELMGLLGNGSHPSPSLIKTHYVHLKNGWLEKDPVI